jgi:hypothetical protein
MTTSGLLNEGSAFGSSMSLLPPAMQARAEVAPPPGTEVAPPPPAQAPDAPATTVVHTTPGGVQIRVPGGASPAQVYQGALQKRRELRETRESVEEQREELSGQLQDPMVTGANRAGLEARIQRLDARLIELDGQIATADAEVAATAGVPGAYVPEPQHIDTGPPEEVFVIPIVFTIFVLGPLSVAYARRIWKRTGTAVAQIPHAMAERFGRLEQAVDAIAVEVERISEGQRFMTKLFADGNMRAIAQSGVQAARTPRETDEP